MPLLTTIVILVIFGVLGVTPHSNETGKDLGPYPKFSGYSMYPYANFNDECVDVVLSGYMQYLPFILLAQVRR